MASVDLHGMPVPAMMAVVLALAPDMWSVTARGTPITTLRAISASTVVIGKEASGLPQLDTTKVVCGIRHNLIRLWRSDIMTKPGTTTVITVVVLAT